MSDNPNDHVSNEDVLLSQLIRSARTQEAGFTRPRGDDIHAYLMGTATEDQQKTIRRALIESEAFREELSCLAQDIERLEHSEHLEREEPDTSPTPSLATFLDRRKHKDKVKSRPRFSFQGALDWFSVPWHSIPLGTAAAAAVAILLVLRSIGGPGLTPRLADDQPPGAISTPGQVPQAADPEPPSVESIPGLGWFMGIWDLEDLQVDPGILISNITRGTDRPEPQSTARKAAEAVFREILGDSDDGKYIRPINEWPTSEKPTRVVLLRYMDDPGNTIGDSTIRVPVLDGTQSELKAWRYVLATRSLFSMHIPADQDSILVSQNTLPPSESCIALTYRTPEGYEGTPGLVRSKP